MTITDKNSVKQAVQKLLDSDMTGYEIQRRTGITRSTIHYLRNGTRSIDNLSWKTISKLYELTKSID